MAQRRCWSGDHHQGTALHRCPLPNHGALASSRIGDRHAHFAAKRSALGRRASFPAPPFGPASTGTEIDTPHVLTSAGRAERLALTNRWN
jgi:hypothetical protein